MVASVTTFKHCGELLARVVAQRNGNYYVEYFGKFIGLQNSFADAIEVVGDLLENKYQDSKVIYYAG